MSSLALLDRVLALPMAIRVLLFAVMVLVFIAAGGVIATLPYARGAEDPMMAMIFNAVFGTLGFAIVTYIIPSRRALQVSLTALVTWAITGFAVLTYALHPLFWLFVLIALALMALLGAGLALLVERLAR